MLWTKKRDGFFPHALDGQSITHQINWISDCLDMLNILKFTNLIWLKSKVPTSSEIDMFMKNAKQGAIENIRFLWDQKTFDENSNSFNENEGTHFFNKTSYEIWVQKNASTWVRL